MKKIKWLLLCAALLASGGAEAINIVPRPQQVEERAGCFVLQPTTRFAAATREGRTVAHFFANRLKCATGYDLDVTKQVKDGAIVLQLDRSMEGEEAYRLEVTPTRVTVAAATPKGLFMGMQSLMQLLPPQIEAQHVQSGVAWRVPCVKIADRPRFAYRGIMLDVCRHFMPLEAIKKQIDLLSMMKINVLHLHLTDDQGWRIEIKKYPLLTQYGAYRTEGDGSRYGGYYTQEQLRELVAYAAERYITIVPELELPGHGLSAIAAYPSLSCRGEKTTPRIIWGIEDVVMCPAKEQTFRFWEDVIDEMVSIFPSALFHIGGDESPRTEWKTCPDCQALIRRLGYQDTEKSSKEAQLQSYVVERIEKYLAQKKRRIIGWDEILEGGHLNPTAVVMSWRGEEGGIAAARAGHPVIMVPSRLGLYLNYYQGGADVEPTAIGGDSPLSKVYRYEPVPKAVAEAGKSKYILGVQGNVWTEYIRDTSVLEYYLYPRALAVAELGWTEPGRKDWEDFVRRVDTDAALRLRARGVNFHIPLPEQKGGSCSHLAFSDSTVVSLFTTRPETILYRLTSGETNSDTVATSSEIAAPNSGFVRYTRPLVLKQSATLQVAAQLPCGLTGPVRTIRAEKMTPWPALRPEAEADTSCRAWIYWGKHASAAELPFLSRREVKPLVKLQQVRALTPVPANVRNVRDYSAIATAYFRVPETGTYEFFSNNAWVKIDGHLVIDNDREPVRRFSRNGGQCVLGRGLHRVEVTFVGGIIGGWPTYWDDGRVNIRTVMPTQKGPWRNLQDYIVQ